MHRHLQVTAVVHRHEVPKYNAWFLQANNRQHCPSSGRNLNCRPSALEGPISKRTELCLTNTNITKTYIFIGLTTLKVLSHELPLLTLTTIP